MHATIRRKNKDWIARNKDNVSEWSDMYTHGKLLQWAIIIKIQLSMVLRYTIDIIISSLKSNLFLPWHSWNIAHLALHNNHSFTNSNNISISPFIQFRGSRCRGRTVVGFTTTCAISAYHHQHYEFEPRSDDVYPMQHYVIKFVSDLR